MQCQRCPRAQASPSFIIHFAKDHQLNNITYYAQIGAQLAFIIISLIAGVLLAAKKSPACILPLLASVLTFTVLFIPTITGDHSITDEFAKAVGVMTDSFLTGSLYGIAIVVIVLLVVAIVLPFIG